MIVSTTKILYLLVAIILIAGSSTLAETELSEAIFYVAWYDVGKAALEGLDGVKKVTSGWKKFREINTVTYDQNIINIEQMIAALKAAGTYRGRAEKWKLSKRLTSWHDIFGYKPIRYFSVAILWISTHPKKWYLITQFIFWSTE